MAVDIPDSWITHPPYSEGGREGGRHGLAFLRVEIGRGANLVFIYPRQGDREGGADWSLFALRLN